MKKIKIFIGSSIDELAEERKDLVVFISALNNKYIDRGIYIEPYICEETSGMMLAEGSQSAHNAYIENDADVCIFMFFKKAGEFTAQELDIAKATLNFSKRPDIFIFFKVIDNTPIENNEIKRMVDKIANEYKHYYRTFQNVDTIKLELLQYLGTTLSSGAELIVKDGKVIFDGSEINPELLSIGNVFAYQNNPDLKRLKAEIEDLEKRMSAALAENNISLMLSVSKELEEKQKLYNGVERDILSMLKRFSECIRNNEAATKPRLDALHCLEIGDVETAKRIMNADEIIASADNTVKLKDLSDSLIEERARNNIDDAVVAIDILKLDVTNPDRFAKIEAVYDSIVPLCKDVSRLDVLYDYSAYLDDQCNYTKAIKVAEKLRYYYSDPDLYIEERKKRRLNVLLANLYRKTNRFEEAEKIYLETISIYRRLIKENPNSYVPDALTIFNNLAILYNNTNRYEEAEKLYLKAHAIYRMLAKKNPDAYLPFVAMTSNNLASLYKDVNRYKESEKLYQESHGIYQILAEKNPDAFQSGVAMTSNNLAILYNNTNRYEEAEKLYLKAHAIYRMLAEKNPNAYLPKVAMISSNLANFYRDSNRYEEAEELYQEAHGIYQILAEKNPDAFQSGVAMTSNNFANFYIKTNQFDEAEQLYQESLGIYQKLAEKNPDTYLSYVAKISNNLAGFLIKTNRYDESEQLYLKAHAIYRMLAEKNPDAYLPFVAMTSNNLANFCFKTNRNDEAENWVNETLALAKKYPQNPICAAIINTLSS